MNLKWAGTGGMPFIDVQPSTAAGPIWIVGGAGYSDAIGPLLPVDPNNPNWQTFQLTMTLAPEATQLRFAVELYGGLAYPGNNAATFDGFTLSQGVCASP
jgi:hypothetical protein